MLRNKKKKKILKHWIYVHWIPPNKKKYFILARRVIIYEIANDTNCTKEIKKTFKSPRLEVYLNFKVNGLNF